MSDPTYEARVTLDVCLRYFREQSEQSGYGFFCGGDPRNFSPDEESCTPEEIQRHRDDCAAWDRGEKPEGPVCHWVSPTTHVLPSGYGLGVYTMVDEEMRDLAEQCERTLGMLGGPP